MKHLGRVVLDCNVILQAVASPSGAANACVEFILRGAATLVISTTIMDEYRAVLFRPAVQRKFPALTNERIQSLFSVLESVALRFDPVAHVVKLPRDPDDERYLDLAVAASASYLVTRDNDLLDLKKNPLPEDLANLLAKVAIVDPPEFLRRCRNQ